MSSDVSISIGIDTSQADANIADLDAKLNAAANKDIQVRNQILTDVRQGLRLVSSLISGMHIATRILRMNLQPWQASLMSMLGSAVTLMQSIAAAMASTVVGIPASLVVAAAAFGLQMAQTTEILSEMANIRAQTDMMYGRINTSQSEIRSIISGLGGF